MLGGGGLQGLVNDTKRDAANENHMNKYECSHLNNTELGGRQKRFVITACLFLTEVQCSQHTAHRYLLFVFSCRAATQKKAKFDRVQTHERAHRPPKGITIKP